MEKRENCSKVGWMLKKREYLVRSRPLSIPESAAQAGKASLATATALSTSFGPELGMVHITLPVLGETLAELPTLSMGLHRAPATQLKGPLALVSRVMARQRLVWRRESVGRRRRWVAAALVAARQLVSCSLSSTPSIIQLSSQPVTRETGLVLSHALSVYIPAHALCIHGYYPTPFEFSFGPQHRATTVA